MVSLREEGVDLSYVSLNYGRSNSVSLREEGVDLSIFPESFSEIDLSSPSARREWI